MVAVAPGAPKTSRVTRLGLNGTIWSAARRGRGVFARVGGLQSVHRERGQRDDRHGERQPPVPGECAADHDQDSTIKYRRAQRYPRSPGRITSSTSDRTVLRVAGRSWITDRKPDTRQDVPELRVDCRLGDLAAVHRTLQGVLDHRPASGEEPLQLDVQRWDAGQLAEHRPHGGGVFADVVADHVPETDEIAAQGAGVGRDLVLLNALDEGGEHEFGLGGPTSVDGGLAGPRLGRHLVDGKPVVAVLAQQSEWSPPTVRVRGPTTARAAQRTPQRPVAPGQHRSAGDVSRLRPNRAQSDQSPKPGRRRGQPVT